MPMTRAELFSGTRAVQSNPEIDMSTDYPFDCKLLKKEDFEEVFDNMKGEFLKGWGLLQFTEAIEKKFLERISKIPEVGGVWEDRKDGAFYVVYALTDFVNDFPSTVLYSACTWSRGTYGPILKCPLIKWNTTMHFLHIEDSKNERTCFSCTDY